MIELRQPISDAQFSQSIYGENGPIGTVGFRTGEKPSLLEQSAQGHFPLIE